MPALSQSLTFQITNGNTTTNSVQIVYLNTASTTLTYVSNKIKGDGYFGSGDGVHTVMYTASPTFIGTMTTQATLALEPVQTDWFDVTGTSVSYRSTDSRSTSTVNCFNFTGNFVWVRGKVRINDGIVQSILLNH
jgi:hypothetical protein